MCFTGGVLYLVRHGRTELNVQGKLQGQVAVPIDDVGHRQAAALASFVHSMSPNIDEVISSPLLRAVQTAEYFDMDVTIDDRWVEVPYGVLEGISTSEVPRDMWDQWRSNPDFAPSGGESFATLVERVSAACTEVLDRAKDQDIVVVTHMSPIKAAVAWSLGISQEIMFKAHLTHGSLCRFASGEFGPVMHSFNEQPFRGADAGS